MSDDAFVTTRSISGERILLVDDVFTTGSRAQSAASALQIAGGTVPAIMVLARRINPEFNSTASTVWHRQESIDFDFTTSLAWLHGSDARG
jgi:orotate phosphoribosyltransferase